MDKYREQLEKDLTTTTIKGVVIKHLKRYEIERFIGKGGQGEVFKAKDLDDKEKKMVAIKYLTLKNDKKDESGYKNKSVYREFGITKLLRHENLINLINVYSPSDDKICLVIPFFPMDLSAAMRENKYHITQGKDIDVGYIMYQLLCAVEYLHQESLRLMHRDIKPGNILIDENDNLKLIDLGYCRQLPKKPKKLTKCGTHPYMAFEILMTWNTEAKYDTQVDMWSLGCILAELLTGEKVCYPGRGTLADQLFHICEFIGIKDEDKKVIEADYWREIEIEREKYGGKMDDFISRCERNLPWRDYYVSLFTTLMKNLLVLNPGKRWTASKCLEQTLWKNICKEKKKNMLDRTATALKLEQDNNDGNTADKWKDLIFKELLDSHGGKITKPSLFTCLGFK